MPIGQRLGSRLGSGLGSALGNPTGFTPGTILFSLLAPGSTETTECAGTDITAVTGQVVTTTGGAGRTCVKADGTMVVVGANKPRVELVNGVLSLLTESTNTNRALWNNDFTNAVWVKTNMTAAADSPGPTGVANSASTLTATAANATCLQTIAGGGTGERNTSVFLRRKTGTGIVDITKDNGVTWTDITASLNASTFTRISCNTYAALLSTNPAAQVDGLRIRTSGDEIEVAYWQNEAANVVTSAIATTSTVVTRGVDYATISNPLSGLNPSKWFLAATATPLLTGGNWVLNVSRGVVSLGNYGAANTAGIFPNATGNASAIVFDGASNSKIWQDTAVLTPGTRTLAFASSAGGGALYVDGVNITPTPTGVGTGIITTQGATNFIGARTATVMHRGHVSNIQIGIGNYPPNPL